MLAPAAWLLATVLSSSSAAYPAWTRQIQVDCRAPGALERALARARFQPQADFVLHGVCEGNFVIERGNVRLRGGAPGSGLSAPAGNPAQLPVLEIVDASAFLQDMIVRGGTLGVLARGWNADVTLSNVDVSEQTDAGVLAYRGASAALFDSTVRDGATGVIAETSATVILQRVTVRNRSVGVVVSNTSKGALTDTTIEHCREAGVNVIYRSDLNILGGALRDNAQVHVNANDGSAIQLNQAIEIGSEGDPTLYALSVARRATIASYLTPVIYGDVGAVNGGSLRLGSTTLHGDLVLFGFSNVVVSNSQVLGIVDCIDGSDAICKQTTTAGAFNCPSTTCGAPAAGTAARASAVREPPAIRAPARDWLRGTRAGEPGER